MPLEQVSKNKKITDYTSKTISPKLNPIHRASQKWPISPDEAQHGKNFKNQKMDTDPHPSELQHPLDKTQDCSNLEENEALKNALGPLINEFKLLWESIDTVHADYANLEQTISKQKEDLQQELVCKIDKNSKQLASVVQENRNLWKENSELKTRLDKLEQDQLINNLMITGIQEGPYEQYGTTKLRVQEMIAETIQSGNAMQDIETTKAIDIVSCKRVGKYRHNFPRSISVTFAKRDDKESFLSNKRQLPVGIFANEEYPLHIK